MHNWTISNKCTARFDNIVDGGGMRIYFIPMFNKGSTGSKMNAHHTVRAILNEGVCSMQFAVPDEVIRIPSWHLCSTLIKSGLGVGNLLPVSQMRPA